MVFSELGFKVYPLEDRAASEIPRASLPAVPARRISLKKIDRR
jgi:hypothetical protein